MLNITALSSRACRKSVVIVEINLAVCTPWHLIKKIHSSSNCTVHMNSFYCATVC